MKQILNRLLNHETLSREEAHDVLTNITQKKYNDMQIAALMAIYQVRGINVEELIGFRQALLDTQNKVDLDAYKPIDIVGTGGDGKNTFNISTCACFVVAGAGYHVAKHGNIGATSVSGASNVIMNHGVKFTNNQDQLKRSMDECGIVYMHAPLFTPAMGAVAPIRKALEVKTFFNLLGPLVNPCQPAYQVLGVADLNQMRLYTNLYQRLKIGFAVVNSPDGYDEISLTGDFKIMTDHYERIFTPSDLGLNAVKAEDIFGGNTQEEACKIFDSVLDGTASEAQKNVVLVNAASAIQVIESNKDFLDCFEIAKESLESGKALKTLKKFIAINQ